MKNIYAGQGALGFFYALSEYMLMRVISLRLTQLTLELLKGKKLIKSILKLYCKLENGWICC